MSPRISEEDVLGTPLTEFERKLAEVHAGLSELAARKDLPPCIRAGTAHALAGVWQMMNDLDIPCPRPEDTA